MQAFVIYVLVQFFMLWAGDDAIEPLIVMLPTIIFVVGGLIYLCTFDYHNKKKK